jgi:hypothetical protein
MKSLQKTKERTLEALGFTPTQSVVIFMGKANG